MRRRFSAERRVHPRINHTLPMQIAVNGYDFSTSTQNVSCVGAYCNVHKYVPPFTKLAIKLSLPLGRRAAAKDGDIECKGVVVRTEDAPSGGFNMAIYFNEIKEPQRKKIARYISQLMPGQVLAAS